MGIEKRDLQKRMREIEMKIERSKANVSFFTGQKNLVQEMLQELNAKEKQEEKASDDEE